MPIKKLFKSVSKVANKVADKIVPKEIAPLLPVAAAFAPMFLPGIGAAVGGGRVEIAETGAGVGKLSVVAVLPTLSPPPASSLP